MTSPRERGVLLLSNRPPHTGIGVYVQMLRAGLVSLGIPTELRHWTGPATDRVYRALRERARIPDAVNPLLYLEEAVRVLGQARFFRATPPGHSIYHVTNAALAYTVRRRRPAVVTVHDMIPFLQPRFATDHLIRHSMKSIANSDRVICISERIRQEVLELTDVDESRARVVMNGVDHSRFRPRDKAIARRRLGLPDEATVVLHVGSEEPRKGVPLLFRVFRQIMNGLPEPLLLRVGERTPVSDRIMDELGISDRVRYLHGLDHLDEADSMGLAYNSAAVFCFPSTYEPFGLPPLEAMASGCPVVASNRTAIPEVVGDAGVLVEAEDVDAYARSILRVLTDKTFAAELVRQGLERAAEFSWERCARETLDVYREVVPGLGATVVG